MLNYELKIMFEACDSALDLIDEAYQANPDRLDGSAIDVMDALREALKIIQKYRE